MNWSPDLSTFSGPKYKMLADAIESAIGDGSLNSGDRLPTHRNLADQLGVTIGTITRGYAEAERRRLVHARVGSGTFVMGKIWEKRDFSVKEQADDQLIDLSLSLPVPGRREQILAGSLTAISADPQRLTPLLEYLPETGLLQHREAMVNWMRYHGMEVSPDNLLITSGGQHANMLTLQGVLKPGDVIVSENLTYPGFINAARQWQLRHIGLEMDEQGVMPEALEQCCKQHQPRLLYITPNLQNPTAGVMSLERRKAILAVAARHNLLILEDDVQFIPPVQRLASLFSLDSERVIYTSSLSKHLAGGLRVGFVCTPPDLTMKLRQAMRNNCWIAPTLMSEVAMEWIDSGEAWQLVQWQWQEIKKRQQLLKEVLGHLELTSQPYGFHAWLKLPEPWRAETFVKQLEAKGVKVLHSELFAVGSTSVPQAVRICISSPVSEDQLKQGLLIIREVLAQEPVSVMRPMVL
ncbi:PLP-dependent aminotransferase family protein [Endozoicomonas sp. OPT23]|uniref:aminotransferase-like domain-containing protein n=1 Tax=Endozoicomonas sp. OPT23 TaxID=2072845 RepID=UPI00129BBE73|nr:PLP-dependent aminotransferase family protein [Endozoicomonas sp. OPT23]MRI32862.1 PLP-dependent aminotransferase family protein [Endozoicomonas sp. OPT23]